MMTSIDGLDDLTRQRPEWAPWLAVIGSALDEIERPEWGAAAWRRSAARERDAPLLAKATLEVSSRAVRRIFEDVMRMAARTGTQKMACLHAIGGAGLDPLSVLEATVNRDHERLTQCAFSAGADADAFCAVAALVAMPLLHACNRRFARTLPEDWAQGYCPVCGGWPAFAEVRGVERNRYLRCSACGGEWQARCLNCPFCGTTDHAELASFVPGQDGPRATVDVCNACLGYVKVLTTLRGSLPAHVILHDLATTEFDIAAAERGFRRTPTPGYALHLKVTGHVARDIPA